MQRLPHVYSVTAAGAVGGDVDLNGADVPHLAAAPPPQFGGPGGRWSPEGLLVAAIASCFILTFRAVARASKLEWTRLECAVEGTLDRVDGALQFTHIVTRASLTAAADTLLCERVMVKAEHDCLIANSLRCPRDLQMEISRVAAASHQEEELSCST